MNFYHCITIVLTAWWLTACGTTNSLTVTPDGCVMTSFKDAASGQTFRAGACLNSDGDVDRITTEWTNAQGILLRTVRFVKTDETIFFYRDPYGQWVRWSSDSGILIGDAPQVAIEAELAPVTRSSSK